MLFVCVRFVLHDAESLATFATVNATTAIRPALLLANLD